MSEPWDWNDHIPSGYEDQAGYGQVSCSCGWDSSDRLDWVAHIVARLPDHVVSVIALEPTS